MCASVCDWKRTGFATAVSATVGVCLLSPPIKSADAGDSALTFSSRPLSGLSWALVTTQEDVQGANKVQDRYTKHDCGLRTRDVDVYRFVEAGCTSSLPCVLSKRLSCRDFLPCKHSCHESATLQLILFKDADVTAAND